MPSLRLAPLTEVGQRSRAGFLVAVGLRMVVAAALVAVLVGLVESLVWKPGASADPVPVIDPCPSPPCFFENEELPGLRQLPQLLPLLGYLLAAWFGATALLLSLVPGRGPRSRRRRLLPVLGPVVVLVAMEVVPHLLNPCLAAAAVSDQLPSGCARTAHGVDVHDRWHALHHAVVGGLPAALGYAVLLRRRRPDLFTAPGAGSASVSTSTAASARRA